MKTQIKANSNTGKATAIPLQLNDTYYNPIYNTVSADSVKINKGQRKLNVVSLFSGVGGMDLGFKGGFSFLGKKYEENPFEIIFANDIFKQAAEVYEDNFKHEVEKRSIADLSVEDFPVYDKEVDIVLGGFPCQTFSYAGNRKSFEDDRGQLYLEMIRVLKHYRPKMFIAENVDGIRNSRGGLNGQRMDRTALDIILEDFEEAGYKVQYHVLNAADFGVPQSRRRVIIMGIRDDLGDVDNQYYPEISNDETGEITGKRWISAKKGIDDLWNMLNKPGQLNHTTRDYSKAKFYPGKKMQGNNRIAADRPAPTIRAEHHGNIEAHYRTTLEDEENMSGWRRLSVRECARLQSFPDNFHFSTSASSAYKMIGNAVPPVMAWHIARATYYTLQKLDLV